MEGKDLKLGDNFTCDYLDIEDDPDSCIYQLTEIYPNGKLKGVTGERKNIVVVFPANANFSKV
jgi:hypothetical protein